MRLKELREQDRSISWFKAQELKRFVEEAEEDATIKQKSQFERAREQALETCNSQFMQALEKLGQGQIDAQAFSAQREQQRYEDEARALAHAQREQQRYRSALKEARLRAEGKADAAAEHKARRAAIQQVERLKAHSFRQAHGTAAVLARDQARALAALEAERRRRCLPSIVDFK
ncbi:hypothetical protein DUNSADRAFT_11491 [Dunaliella salina]|uniref:Uncharacterized protein n=1 Tax=Dunaliella salina TaxID=3046 RepID=A0ABQ7GD85_DUNSA|nr:hypothetical protein DUNSADRAFT_11491 [Dunaliella salina]|eukprot:KAF5832561.1 hypothetical protein DUNSADRAFT_11491 [Dunaliella salina]